MFISAVKVHVEYQDLPFMEIFYRDTVLPIFLNASTTHQAMEIHENPGSKRETVVTSWWREVASHFPNLLRWTSKTTGGSNLIAG